jgi:hypothetical protein
MVHAAHSNIFADPGDILEFRLSLHRRQHKLQNADIDAVWSSGPLKSWTAGPGSAILVVQGSLLVGPHTLAVGTFMTKFVQSEKVTALWALQNLGPGQHVKTTCTQIIKYLAMQALRLEHETISNRISQSFNQTRISSAHTIEHWTTILSMALKGVPVVYVLIDLDLMDLADPSASIAVLLQSLSELILACEPTVLKIVLINKLRTVTVNLPSGGAETLSLEKILRSGTHTSRVRSRQQMNHTTMRGKGSLPFRSRLQGQRSARS